jgi:uncharacterized protein YbjT (DUF2867 family)
MDTLIRTSARTLIQVGEALGIRNLDPDSGKIFVTGGTGVISRRVAERLLHAGYPSVRVGTKNPASLADLNHLGAEIADFCWDNEDTYDKALNGVSTVFCTIPYTHIWYKKFPLFLAACVRAGVKHIVKLSIYHARNSSDTLFQQVPLVREHGDCDDRLIRVATTETDLTPLMHSELSYTILYASHLMSNPFTFQGHELHSETCVPSTLFGASGNHGVNYVSPNDVAEVAVRALVAPQDHYNKEYTLTGPEAITDQQVASLLSKHLRKAIMYVDQPLHEFASQMQLSGEPKWIVADLVALEKIKATGTEETEAFISTDFESICGHPPESYEEYLRGSDMMTKIEAGSAVDLQPLKAMISA